MRRLLPTLCILICTLTLCPDARAQDIQQEPSFEALDALSQQRISELLDLIEGAVALERYDSALSYLDEAQQLFDHPEFWLDRARILEAMGRHQEAAGWIKRFTLVRPDSPRTTTLSRRAIALANTPDRPNTISAAGSLRITSSPQGAKVTFRDQSATLKGSTPTIAIPVTRPKTFIVTVSKPGYLSEERDIAVKPGEARKLDVTLSKDPDSPLWKPELAQPQTTHHHSRGAGPWLLWGLGAAGVAGMIVSSQRTAQLDAMAANGENVSRERSRTRGVFIASTTAAFAGVIGGTLLWFARSPEHHAGTTSLILSPGSTGVRITF